MKKLLTILVLPVLMMLTSCNYKVIDLKYHFTKVHIISENKCYEIDNWRDYDDGDQLQVKIKDHGYCLFHANQVVLVEDKCPFCGD